MQQAGGNTRFEDELARHGSFVYRNMGVSMRPLIKQGRDVMVIQRKPDGRCRKYDIVLYRRGGAYVLHRVVKVLADGYVICGDNCTAREYDVTDADILGVMTARVRSGRELRMDAIGPRCYARLWCALYPVRLPVMKGARLARRVARKVLGQRRASVS